MGRGRNTHRVRVYSSQLLKGKLIYLCSVPRGYAERLLASGDFSRLDPPKHQLTAIRAQVLFNLGRRDPTTITAREMEIHALVTLFHIPRSAMTRDEMRVEDKIHEYARERQERRARAQGRGDGSSNDGRGEGPHKSPQAQA